MTGKPTEFNKISEHDPLEQYYDLYGHEFEAAESNSKITHEAIDEIVDRAGIAAYDFRNERVNFDCDSVILKIFDKKQYYRIKLE